MPKNYFPALLITATLLCGTAAHAEVYRWVDVNGITHYSDAAPATRQQQTFGYGQLNRPSPPQRAFKNTRMSFPGQPLRATSNATPKQKPRLKPRLKRQSKRKAVMVKRSNTTRARPTLRPKAKTQAATKPQAQALRKSPPQQQDSQPFREFQLIDKPAPTPAQAALLEQKPNLNAAEYDLYPQPASTDKKPIKNVKQTLCSEKRMLLAALQETGFKSYTDEEGHYRLAWGGDGIYQGKRRFLSDGEISLKTKQVTFEVEQYCDKPNDQKRQDAARANWIRAEYCALSQAVLEDLEHPFMRATDDRIEQQNKEVEQLCAELAPGRHRNDNRYYPVALQADVTLPRYLTLKEDEASQTPSTNPKETLEQLLALIQ